MATVDPQAHQPGLHEHHRRIRRKAWGLHVLLALALAGVLAWYWFRIFFCWGSRLSLWRENFCRASFIGPVLIFAVAGITVWSLVRDMAAFGRALDRDRGLADAAAPERSAFGHFRHGVRQHRRHATAAGVVAVIAVVLFLLLLIQLF